MSTPVMHRGPVPAASRDVADIDTVDRISGTFLPVANGTHFNGNWGHPSTSLIQTRCRQSRKLLRIIAGGADRLQVEWANIYTTTVAPSTDASCELNGPNSVTVRMAIEYPAGTMRITSGSSAWSSATAYIVGDQVVHSGTKYLAVQAGTNQTPSGSSAFWRVVNTYIVRWVGDTDANGTVVFAAGSYKKSIPVALSERVAAGERIAILGAFDSGGSSNYIPYAGSNGAANHGRFVDWIVDAAGGMPAIGSSIVETGITNQTNGNTTTANASDNSTWMKIPYATAITGNIPNQRCIAIFGDSIAQGFGGDIRDGEPCGLFPRALDSESWWRVAQGGNRAQNYTRTNAPWQFSVLQRCTSTICALGGLNDIMNSGTEAQLKSWLERLWRALLTTGRPIYTGLLTPISASSDAWATTVNQSRYTAGGTIPTTQFPNDDATYLTSIYGKIAMWISQDGASVLDDSGATVKAGQAGHPLSAILDWRQILSDPATSWKWIGGLTADGAHPNALAVGSFEAPVLRRMMEPVIMGNTLQPQGQPSWDPSGQCLVQSMPRSFVESNSTAAAGSVATYVGCSPGGQYTQLRFWLSTVASGVTFYTVLAGADPAKMKVIDSGSNTFGGAGALATITFATMQYIPAGYGVELVLTSTAASNRAYAGRVIAGATSALHVSGSGFVLGGTSSDTGAALTGVINMFSKFTASTFRAWAELV